MGRVKSCGSVSVLSTYMSGDCCSSREDGCGAWVEVESGEAVEAGEGAGVMMWALGRAARR